MKLFGRFCALVVLLGSVLVTTPAQAETTAFTKISQIQVLESADAKYKLYQGVVWLEIDKATSNYRWGGKQCQSESLSEHNLRLLLTAFQGKHSISVHYRQRQHADHTYRCITGFTVSR